MTASSRPTILIVPGAWQLATAFEPFADLLRASGLGAECVRLPSTGATAGEGLAEDAAAVRAALVALVVEAGREVVVLAHSAGGVSGSAAVRGLDAGTRRRAGLPGGVTRVVYMAAFLLPAGASVMGMLGGRPLPWMVIEGDRVSGDPEMVPGVSLTDLSPQAQKKAMRELTFSSAALFAGASEYEPWKEGIPCAYIFTKQDGALPYPLQQQMAAQLGSDPLTITLDANHCPFLSMPQELLAAVEKIVAA